MALNVLSHESQQAIFVAAVRRACHTEDGNSAGGADTWRKIINILWMIQAGLFCNPFGCICRKRKSANTLYFIFTLGSLCLGADALAPSVRGH